MSDLEDLKTRLKIARSKLQNQNLEKADKKKGVFLGNAFKLGTELVAAVAVGTILSRWTASTGRATSKMFCQR